MASQDRDAGLPTEVRAPLRRARQIGEEQSLWEPDPSSPDGGIGPGHHVHFSWRRARDQAWNTFQDEIPGWNLYRNWHRYRHVIAAVSSSGEQAGHLMVLETGETLNMILAGLLPSLLDIAKWVGLGAIIGGGIGALGGPADELTVPAGAATGAEVGLWIANSLGLASLLVGLLKNLGGFVEYAAAATEIAWNAGEDHASLEHSDLVQASTLYAYAIGELWMALLTAMVFEVMKRAAKFAQGQVAPGGSVRMAIEDVSKDIAKSELGVQTGEWFRSSYEQIRKAVEKRQAQLNKANLGDGGIQEPQTKDGSSQNKRIVSVPASKVATKPNSAFFWSGRTNGVGGADVAGKYASGANGTTLEQLIDARDIQMPRWNPGDPASVQAWKDVSSEYAQNASGTVRAVIGQDMRPENVWETSELPCLMTNPNVTEIIKIDPATGEQTTIFKR